MCQFRPERWWGARWRTVGPHGLGGASKLCRGKGQSVVFAWLFSRAPWDNTRGTLQARILLQNLSILCKKAFLTSHSLPVLNNTCPPHHPENTEISALSCYLGQWIYFSEYIIPVLYYSSKLMERTKQRLPLPFPLCMIRAGCINWRLDTPSPAPSSSSTECFSSNAVKLSLM